MKKIIAGVVSLAFMFGIITAGADSAEATVRHANYRVVVNSCHRLPGLYARGNDSQNFRYLNRAIKRFARMVSEGENRGFASVVLYSTSKRVAHIHVTTRILAYCPR